SYIYAAIAAVVILFLVARERAVFRRTGAKFPSAWPWLATSDGAIWLLPPFAAAAIWQFWPLAVLVYAIISLILLQNMVEHAVGQRG
ncbi:MAG: hypothetical protein HKN78_12430, partial [Sphingomonadaceae bacterium]|nr:hypothetical protein [Sphingomonadaceae bacterium]